MTFQRPLLEGSAVGRAGAYPDGVHRAGARGLMQRGGVGLADIGNAFGDIQTGFAAGRRWQ
jgi:hypothetical protein